MAHRHQRRRRRRRGTTEEADIRAYAGGGSAAAAAGGGVSGTATPFTGAATTPFASNSSSSSVRAAGVTQMLPPPSRGASGTGTGGGGAADLSRVFAGAVTPVGAPSTAGSAAGGGGGGGGGGGLSTTKSQKSRGAFFPEGGGGGAAAGRGVVPPPPSPHHQSHPPGTPLLGSGITVGAAGMAAAMAVAAQEAEYRGLCERVLGHKDHKEASVRRTVMALLPELAAFFPGGTGDFVEPAVWFLINTLRQVRSMFGRGLCLFFIFAFLNVWNDRASVLSGAEVTSEMRGLRRCAKDTGGAVCMYLKFNI